MRTNEIDVRAAHPDEAASVAAVLRDAFDADPVINWMLRADARRDDAFAQFYAANVAEYLGAGRRVDVAIAGGEPVAAAMWTPPPGAQPTPFRERLALWGLREWTGVRRFPRFWRLVAATEARYPRVRHQYLFMIGARSDRQGQGLGSHLLAPVLAECDAANVPAYLESSNPRNVSFYERHGFRVRERLSAGLGAPPMHLMWREPRPAGQSPADESASVVDDPAVGHSDRVASERTGDEP